MMTITDPKYLPYVANTPQDAVNSLLACTFNGQEVVKRHVSDILDFARLELRFILGEVELDEEVALDIEQRFKTWTDKV